MLHLSKKPYAKFLTALASVFVFILDLMSNSGVAISVLYLVCLLLTLNQEKKTIVFFACLSSVLILVDLGISLDKPTHYSVFIDKIISLVAIWFTVGIIQHYRTLSEKKEEQRARHLQAVEEMLHITSHKVRKPVCTIQGLTNVFEMANSPEETEHIIQRIRISAKELNEFTEYLTRYIHRESRTH